MIDDLLVLVERLAAIIEAETKLLDELDLPAAGALAAEKLGALKALQTTYLDAERQGLKPEDPDQAEVLRAAITALATLSDANRAAIERGLALQMRLIHTIANAVPRAMAEQAPIYQQDGSQAPPRPPEAFAFLQQM